MCACFFFLLNTWTKLDQTLRKSGMDEGDFFLFCFSEVPSLGSICGDQFLSVSFFMGHLWFFVFGVGCIFNLCLVKFLNFFIKLTWIAGCVCTK